MTIIQKTALVPHSARDMFALVDDIARYPEFLPWCKAASITERQAHQVFASLTLAVAGLEKTFTTRNPIEPERKIEMFLVQGPFSHLHGRWDFQPLGEVGCKVSLAMEFEFSNAVLRLTLGPIFNKIVNTLVDSFIERAGDLYGKS
jgi:ribosome-associated toxin RatA of RatAB toxin-antitoxin module